MAHRLSGLSSLRKTAEEIWIAWHMSIVVASCERVVRDGCVFQVNNNRVGKFFVGTRCGSIAS